MFTGIVEEKGTVVSMNKGGSSTRLSIKAKKIFSDLKMGDSVAVNGVCLTVAGLAENVFTADIMNETLGRSSLGGLRVNDNVNLERAMAADGRFGGHIVSGHIDGMGKISAIQKDGNAVWYEVSANPKLMRYIVEKGSVAIDGISLTVAKVEKDSFSVSVIPHTAKETVLSAKGVGDTVNLENDVVGKYVERLLNVGSPKEESKKSLTIDFLHKAGF